MRARPSAWPIAAASRRPCRLAPREPSQIALIGGGGSAPGQHRWRRRQKRLKHHSRNQICRRHQQSPLAIDVAASASIIGSVAKSWPGGAPRIAPEPRPNRHESSTHGSCRRPLAPAAGETAAKCGGDLSARRHGGRQRQKAAALAIGDMLVGRHGETQKERSIIKSLISHIIA